MTKNEMLAYTAGFWDGEGTFTLTKYTRESGAYYYPYVVVSNTDEDVLNTLAEFILSLGINCKVYTKYRNNEPDKHKQRYSLNICGQENMLMFCELITPFLVVKRLHARFLAAFIRLRTASKFTDTGMYDTEMKTFVDALHELNKRGVDIMS